MKYRGLKKEFHINEQESNKLYQNRFNSESCNKLGIELNGFECFYIVNDEILNLLGNIYAINMWLEQCFSNGRLPTTSKQYLIITSLLEEIKSSNKMEGIYSTRKELQEMMSQEPPKKYKRFYGMVSKYSKISNEEFSIIESSADIRNLYDEILLKDVINEDKKDKPDGVFFRKEMVEISSGTRVIHTGISGEKNIIAMMEKALKILNDENINFLIRVAVFHYLFEYIHPFYNGNGRMGRFLATGYLSKHLNILSAFQLSIACLHNSSKYYEAFELTNDIRNKSDLTIFIIYFLEIYLSGLEELKDKIDRTTNIYKTLKLKIENNINEKHQILMNILLEITLFGPSNPSGFTMSDLVEIMSTTQQTIRKNINEINAEHTIIYTDKEHKPYRYTLDINKIIEIY